MKIKDYYLYIRKMSSDGYCVYLYGNLIGVLDSHSKKSKRQGYYKLRIYDSFLRGFPKLDKIELFSKIEYSTFPDRAKVHNDVHEILKEVKRVSEIKSILDNESFSVWRSIVTGNPTT